MSKKKSLGQAIISPCVQDQSGLIIYIQYIIIYIQNEIVRASHYLSLCAGSERVMYEALQQLARAQLCEKEEERRKENAKILILQLPYISVSKGMKQRIHINVTKDLLFISFRFM